jgi:hypothetical protein
MKCLHHDDGFIADDSATVWLVGREVEDTSWTGPNRPAVNDALERTAQYGHELFMWMTVRREVTARRQLCLHELKRLPGA